MYDTPLAQPRDYLGHQVTIRTFGECTETEYRQSIEIIKRDWRESGLNVLHLECQRQGGEILLDPIDHTPLGPVHLMHRYVGFTHPDEILLCTLPYTFRYHWGWLGRMQVVKNHLLCRSPEDQSSPDKTGSPHSKKPSSAGPTGHMRDPLLGHRLALQILDPQDEQDYHKAVQEAFWHLKDKGLRTTGIEVHSFGNPPILKPIHNSRMSEKALQERFAGEVPEDEVVVCVLPYPMWSLWGWLQDCEYSMYFDCLDLPPASDPV